MLGHIQKHMDQMNNNNLITKNNNIINVWYLVSSLFRYWYSHIKSKWVLSEYKL